MPRPYACALRLAAENMALRHPLTVLERSVKRPKLRQPDRIFWRWLSRLRTGWRPTCSATPGSFVAYEPPSGTRGRASFLVSPGSRTRHQYRPLPMKMQPGTRSLRRAEGPPYDLNAIIARVCNGSRERLESSAPGAWRGGRNGRCARRNCHKNCHKTHAGAVGGENGNVVSLGFGATYGGVPRRIRTSNLWLRRPTLYPIELWGRSRRRILRSGAAVSRVCAERAGRACWG